ncbi:hypothetical protein [Haladaptatus salinisoli]|uniref:hypothetical protein n=1 Tax=Haladaptatus salinisoli TaxID=2884876 RepID=UPI001D0BCFD4|nr:hypothetical protein [Haladaptatus salinisoli]
MSLIATENEVVSGTARWLRGLWDYYLEYTHTAIHAASAAALTAFGLLIFIDRLFVLLAIAAYVCPPIILYSLGSDVGKTSTPPDTHRLESATDAGGGSDGGSASGDGNSNGSDGDTDSDGDDGDTDSDGDDGDTDSDSDDGDTDSDS